MNLFKKILPAVIVALGLTAIGIGINKGLKSVTDNRRTVSVRGLSEREVKADKVTWPIVFKLVGNDLQDLYTQINQTDDQIVKFLTDNGIASADISINAPDVIDQQANRYISNERIPYRYNITSVIVVTSSDVDNVNELIKRQVELFKYGIAISTDEYSYQTQYEFTGLNDIKPEMIADATNKARQAAIKFAEDSQSKLGKIATASQGQFSITDRDQYTPYIKSVRVVTTIDYFLED
jgi:hypothetical protein